GDVVTGAATVISAMGAGKKAAKAIDEYLKEK
ncbi:MAG: glutamate synthase, partial [Alphaproteobacteria bacterium]